MQYVFAQTYRAFPSPSGMIWSDVDITHQGPMQLLITALVRCTILTLDSIIIKQRNSVTSYRIDLRPRKPRTGTPHCAALLPSPRDHCADDRPEPPDCD